MRPESAKSLVATHMIGGVALAGTARSDRTGAAIHDQNDIDNLPLYQLLHEAFQWLELLESEPLRGWPEPVVQNQRFWLEQIRDDYGGRNFDAEAHQDALARLRSYCKVLRRHHGGASAAEIHQAR